MLREIPELKKLFYQADAYTEDIDDALDHGMAVSNLAYQLSKMMGLDAEFCDEMLIAGVLHDIGKLKVGAYLYGRRKESLKIEEIKYVRMHPKLGHEILKKSSLCSDTVLDAVYHHHENYDGTGYPDNLKGENIPLGARILRICDVYAALVSKRPYRAEFEQDTAIELMIDEVKNFDMRAFLAFMKLVHSDEYNEIKNLIARANRKIKTMVS